MSSTASISDFRSLNTSHRSTSLNFGLYFAILITAFTTNESEAAVKQKLFFFTLCVTLLWSPYNLRADDGTLGFNSGINPNPHNLSIYSTSGANKAISETQICIFCHIPHGATPQSKLWGRPDPVNMGSFPIFNSASVKDPGDPTKNLGIDDIVATTGYSAASSDYPNGASKLCLSCHDGVTAMGTLATGLEIDMTGTGKALKVIDLSKTHPISFVYTQAVEDYLNTAGAEKFYTFNYYSGSKAIPLDGASRIQCTICHEPHKNTRFDGYTLPFWRMRGAVPNAAVDYDNTCKVCHSTTYYGGANHNIIP